MDIEYRIDKNKLKDKFKAFVDKNSDSTDTYNSKGKEVQYRNDYTVLDKIKAIYRFVVNNIKMDLRREFIHDDDKFYEALNLLNDRVNNKIRSKTDGTLYILVGLDNPIKFNGDDDQYKQYVYMSNSKQQQLIRKIVDELNSVLEKNENEEEDRAIINDDDIPDQPVVLTTEDIADHILSNISSDDIVELHKGNFESFDKSFALFIKESGVDPKLGEGLLESLHSVYSHTKMYWETINEAEDDRKLTNTDQMKDNPNDKSGTDNKDKETSKSGADKRREQSRETLQKRNLKPAGGVWQDAQGNSVAKIDDQGNIENIVQADDASGGDSGSISDMVGQYQNQQTDPQGAAPSGEEEEPEVETGLDNDELEKIRTTFDDEIKDEK